MNKNLASLHFMSIKQEMIQTSVDMYIKNIN